MPHVPLRLIDILVNNLFRKWPGPSRRATPRTMPPPRTPSARKRCRPRIIIMCTGVKSTARHLHHLRKITHHLELTCLGNAVKKVDEENLRKEIVAEAQELIPCRISRTWRECGKSCRS